jgi:peroxiredoxin family protein
MAGRVIFFLQSATFEPAYQVTSLGITAAAMGDEVYVVVAFDALRQLMRGRFGMAHTERELSETARAEGLRVPPPAQMLTEARGLGLKVIASDTMVKLCGFATQEVERVLDEVMGLPSLWRLTDGARVLSF